VKALVVVGGLRGPPSRPGRGRLRSPPDRRRGARLADEAVAVLTADQGVYSIFPT